MNLIEQATQPQLESYPTIPLNGNLFAIVDLQDYDFLMQWVGSWYARWQDKGQTFYAQRMVGKKVIAMHRLLLDAPTGMQVDHINHLGLDNRRCNLRLATQSQNQANRRLHRNNTSGFKGVVKVPGGKWQANIRFQGRDFYLGRFTTPEAAHVAYANKARELFGEFANP